MLLCFHEGQTNIYVNGLPLAIVKGEAVELAKVDPLKATETRFSNVGEVHFEVNHALECAEAAIEQQREAKA